MSYYALAIGIGWAAGPLTGALLYRIRPEVPFVGCFVLSLLAALLAATLIKKAPLGSHHGEAILSVLTPNIIVPISAGALYGYLMSSLVTLFPLYLKKEINVPEAGMAGIITAVILGTIVSQVPIGRAADRFGKRKTPLICTLLLAVVFLAMSRHTDWRLFLVTGVMAGSFAGSLYPIGLALIGEIVKKERLGAATSTFSLAFGIGSLVGPSVSGLAMTHFDNPKLLLYIPSLLSIVFVIEIIVLYTQTAMRRSKS